jgi:methionyl-tRNA synthetase
MVRNYCDGRIPAFPRATERDAAGEPLLEQARGVQEAVERSASEFDRAFDAYDFSRALEAIWVAIGRLDKFISDAKPWELARSPERRPLLDVVLATATEALRHFAVLLSPVLPESSQSIWEQLGESGECADVLPSSLAWGNKKVGTTIGEVKQLFPRLEKRSLWKR